MLLQPHLPSRLSGFAFASPKTETTHAHAPAQLKNDLTASLLSMPGQEFEIQAKSAWFLTE